MSIQECIDRLPVVVDDLGHTLMIGRIFGEIPILMLRTPLGDADIVLNRADCQQAIKCLQALYPDDSAIP